MSWGGCRAQIYSSSMDSSPGSKSSRLCSTFFAPQLTTARWYTPGVVMEPILVASAALGLGAFATFLLATLLPEELIARGQDHGRYAYLGKEDDAAKCMRSQRMEPSPSPRLFNFLLSRTSHNS